MLRRVPEIVSHDGGDTGFLNCIFEDWFSGSSRARRRRVSHGEGFADRNSGQFHTQVARLPFRYNAQRAAPPATYSLSPSRRARARAIGKGEAPAGDTHVSLSLSCAPCVLGERAELRAGTMHWMTSEKAPGYWNVCKPIKILHFSSSPKPWEDPKRKGELELIWWQHYIQTQLSF